MLPNFNFNPSFANLAALHGISGIPHPIRPVGPVLNGPMTQNPTGAPMPVPMPVYSGLPAQRMFPMQNQQQLYPQGDLGNLQALMQILGRFNG